MFTYMRRFLKDNVVIVILLTLYSLIQVISAVLFTYATNALFQHRFDRFMTMIAAQLIVWVGLSVLDYYESVYQVKVIQKMSLSIRDDISHYLAQSKLSNEKMFSRGNSDVLSWYSNDINQVEESGFASFYALIGFVTQALFSIIAMASYHYILLLVTLGLTVIMTYGPNLLTKALEKKSFSVSKQNEKLLATVTDLIDGLATIISLRSQKHLLSSIHDKSKELMSAKVVYAKNRELLSATISFIGILSQILVDLTTGLLVLGGKITFGSITTTGQLASNIFYSISRFSDLVIEMKSARPIFQKFPKVSSNSEEMHAAVTEGSAFNELAINIPNYSVGNKEVFNQLSLSIKAHEKIIITGDSGSGKTTLLRAIAGYNQALRSSISLDGQTLADMNDDDIVRLISYVPQKPYLFNASVKENITMWRPVSDDDLTRIETTVGIDQQLASKEQVDNNETTVSGGERQRIALARSLVNEPQIMLFDEGTSNLDHNSALEIENYLLNTSFAVVIITHHLSNDLRANNARILRLIAGHLVNVNH